MKRVVVLLLTFALMLSCMAIPASASGDVTINFWAGMTGSDKDALEKIVRSFEEATPGVKVEFYSAPWTEMFTKFAASFGTASGPDIMVLHTTDVPNYSEMGMLSDVEDIAAEMGITADQYSEAVWSGCNYGGTQWAIPFDYHPMGVYKNKALFEAAGVDPEIEFTSAEQFIEVCKQLTVTNDAGEVTQYALGIGSDHAHTMRYWYGLLYQNGGQFLNEDGTQAAFHSEAGIEALQWLSDLVHVEQVVPYHESDIDADFISGKIAMVIEGPWFIPTLAETSIEYETCKFPQIFDNYAVWANSHALAIPAFSASGERLEAAKTLLRYLVENSIMWSTGGQIPANYNVVESEEYKALPEYKHFKTFIDEAPYVVYEPLIPKTAELGADNQLSPVLNAVYVPVRGDGTAADALNEAAALTDAILAE